MTGAVTGVLYVLVCGSSAARGVGRLVDLAQREGWQVCVIASPDGAKFIDIPALERVTGYPVRTRYKHPAEPDVLPPPDALIVAPATANTVNKWAAGISDTLPLGLLAEGLGKGLPIVAMPFTNVAHAAHPAFARNIRELRSWGVRVLYGDDVMPLPQPGTGDACVHLVPWHLALRALDDFPAAAPAPERDAGSASR